jgi:SanA protein
MKKRNIILLSFSVILVLFVTIPFWIVLSGKKAIYLDTASVEPVEVGIVFGAGLTVNGDPSDALMDRLTVAADLFAQEKIKTIFVSGDNRFENYNEPEVMASALEETFQIPKENIVIDYAGRRTYDTCVRANEIWGVDHAVLITQGYHLPRAIWTCKRLGIESTGVSASLQPYILSRQFKIREVAAIYKAFIDIYLIPPDYISGDFEKDLDE